MATSTSTVPGAGQAGAGAKGAGSGLGIEELLIVASPRAWIALIGLLVLVVGVLIWSIVGQIPGTIAGRGVLLRGSIAHITAPIDGTVAGILVNEGDTVQAGATVATLNASDGTQQDVKTTQAGTVTSINTVVGFPVSEKFIIMAVEDTEEPLTAAVYVPFEAAKGIKPGMEVQLAPTVASVDAYGYLMGTVQYVSEFPVSASTFLASGLLSDEASAGLQAATTPMLQVIVSLQQDGQTQSGYRWSSSRGPNHRLSSGTPTDARIITDYSAPIDSFLPLGN